MPHVVTHVGKPLHTQKPTKKKQPHKKPIRHKPLKGIVPAFLRGVIVGALGIFLLASSIYAGYSIIYHLVAPDIQSFLEHKAPESTKLYAKDGTLMYEVYKDVKRTNVPLNDVSPHFIHAILTAEDRDFYTHPGVSFSAIIRAYIQNALFPDQLSGGSTITQQLVKNVILTPEKSIYRKIAEAIWSMELESKLSKDKILESYINQIDFGRNSAGIEAASVSYFGKSAHDLTAAESAYLAAIPKAPSLLRPGGSNETTLEERQQFIIQTMHDLGYLNDTEYTQAVREKVTFINQKDTIVAPYFSLWIKQQLIQQYGADAVYSKGFRVQTTLDLNLQQLAENTVKEFAAKNKKTYRAYNASLVAIDPRTGGVLAFVGGKDYYGTPEPAGCIPGKNCLFDPNTNVATSLRQVGSSFKPYVYVTAFGPDFRYSPSTIVSDVSKNFSAPGSPAYIPHNYTGQQFGRVPIRKALAGSLNIAAVNTLSQIGIEPVVQTLRDLGITAPLKNCGLALALGGCEISLLEHTNGFATFANLGKRNSATGIAEIIDGTGKLVLQNSPEQQQVINPQAAYELIDIMTDNDARSYIFGKNSPLTLPDRKVAAKTGTTQNWRDGFTVGYTPSLAVGVWTGNNDGTLMHAGADGVITAAPLWHAFMETALKGTPAEEFTEPEGITRLAINPSTGKVVKGKAKSGKLEVFASYAIPYEDFQLPVVKPKKPATGSVKPNFGAVINGDEEATAILEPWAGETVFKTPFDIKVYTGTSTDDTTVELKLDGKPLTTLQEAPFFYTVNDMLSNGMHTLTATATHFGILESTSTVKFKTFFNPPPISPRGNMASPEPAKK